MRLVLLVIAAAAGCAPARRAPMVNPGDTGASERETFSALAADLRATVLEAYDTLNGSYDEAYLDGLAHDRRLLLIDVGPADVVIGFHAQACDLRRRLPGDSYAIVSKTLDVHVAADKTLGWTFAEQSYRVTRDGRTAFVPLRATAVYERREGRWLLVQEHVSYGVPTEKALRDAASFPAPARPASFGSYRPPGAAADAVADVLRALLRDDEKARRAHVSTRNSALLVGSSLDRELRGDAIAQAPTLRALYGYEFTTRAENLRVQVSRSGAAAWAAAHVAVEGARHGRRVTLHVRATWVLEKRDGVWWVVQTHVSVPVEPQELAYEVFGGVPPVARVPRQAGAAPASSPPSQQEGR